MTAPFSPGDIVFARGREWVTLPSPDDEWLHLRPLSGAEADVQVFAQRPSKSISFDLHFDATGLLGAALLASFEQTLPSPTSESTHVWP